MGHLRFLATTRDGRPGKEDVVYGAEHQTDFDQDDAEFVLNCWHQGRVEVTDWSGITPPVGYAQPAEEETPPA